MEKDQARSALAPEHPSARVGTSSKSPSISARRGTSSHCGSSARTPTGSSRSFWICDYQENMERFRYFAQTAKAEGAEVVTSLMYTVVLFTMDHGWRKTRLIADSRDCIDWIDDLDGVRSDRPGGHRELLSIVQKNATAYPLEFPRPLQLRPAPRSAIWRRSSAA